MKIPSRKEIRPVDPEVVIASAASAAKALVACGDGFEITSPADASGGASFRIPVLIPEETETGDSREFEFGAITSRDLPLPLYWQVFTAEGHNGSVIVGRIDYVERLGGPETAPLPIDEGTVADVLDSAADTEESDDLLPHESPMSGWGNAYGVFDTGVYGREAERLVRGGFLRGVSADLDKFEAAVRPSIADTELATDDNEDDKSDDEHKIKNDKIVVTQARIMGATLVGKPAFQECTIEIVDTPYEEELPIEDGMYEEAVDDDDLYEASLVASAAPDVPPRDWFKNPGLKAPTPITVTDDGQVFGHIAAWHVDHIGLPRNTKPPRSYSNYAYFRTGVLRTDDGTDVPVGQLTLAGGHAGMALSAQAAVKHYDDTASAIADVAAGEDAHGIWVAGALRSTATAAQVRALRASAPSGDWRPINGRLELVAVCQVNVPGFPVARAMVAGGQVMALVAAGAKPLAEIRESRLSTLESRLDNLEAKELEAIRASALEALAPLKTQHDTELTAKADKAKEAIFALRESQNAELQAQAAKARAILLGE